jgi:hypothetical protein
MLPPPDARDYLLRRWRLRQSVRTLQQKRRDGNGPAFRRAGNTVTYTPAALDRWVVEWFGTEVRSTTEEFERRRVSAVTE